MKNRERLLADDKTMPKTPNGSDDPYGYLQHHRHAEPTILHLCKKCDAVKKLPRAGVRLTVHSRYDTNMCPPDWLVVAKDQGEANVNPLDFHLFNWTGMGLEGYHYDVLIPKTAA